MQICEVETKTGITRQNIRFYEKKGLLCPGRNEENHYRDYTDDDVALLLQIKILRRLNLPIEDIRRILNGEETETILRRHLDDLVRKQTELDAAMQMCRLLLSQKADLKHPVEALSRMDAIEQKGGRFMDIQNDYRKISDIERRQSFSFIPDQIIMTPEAFTDALLAYARERNLNLTVTEPGMYPKFEIDGLEYEAYRTVDHRYTAVYCKATQPIPSEALYNGAKKKRLCILRNLYRMKQLFIMPTFVFAVLLLCGVGFWPAIFSSFFFLLLALAGNITIRKK